MIVLAVVVVIFLSGNNLISEQTSQLSQFLKALGFGVTFWYKTQFDKWTKEGGKTAPFKWEMAGLILIGLVLQVLLDVSIGLVLEPWTG